MTTNRERAGLALMGCAIGDCLGFPFENAFVPSGWDGEPILPLSAWTDDTQQSLVLVDDVLRHGDLSAVRVMERFVAMAAPGGRPSPSGHFGLHRHTGRGFRYAVTHYRKHGTFGALADRAGNGAAMRSVAVAFALGESDDARRAIREVASTTHVHPASIDAALAVAEAAWGLLRGLRGPDLLEAVAAAVPLGDVRASLFAAAATDDPISALSRSASAAVGVSLGAGAGHALCSPLAAIAVAAMARTLVDGVRAAVRVGGDTDSTAAITGALLAGVVGLDGVPPSMLSFPGAETLRRWGQGPLPTLEEWWALERGLCQVVDN